MNHTKMVESYTPSHKDFRVDFRAGEYHSSLKTLKVKFPVENNSVLLLPLIVALISPRRSKQERLWHI